MAQSVAEDTVTECHNQKNCQLCHSQKNNEKVQRSEAFQGSVKIKSSIRECCNHVY